MEIKMRDLINGETSLAELIKQELPLNVGMALAIAVNELAPSLRIYHEKERELGLKYTKEPTKEMKPGIRPFIDVDSAKAFEEGINLMLDETININSKPISVGKLGDLNYLAEKLLPLSWLFAE